MKTQKSVLTYIALIVGVAILVNILSNRFFFRLDFSADKRYTLSKATKNILDSLKETVTITAYFSENLPAEIAQVKRDFKDQLVEYASRSHGKIMYEFVNPNKDTESEQNAAKAGIQPLIISSGNDNESKQQKAFLGALIQMGERKEVIPVVQPGTAMEYSLSTSLKKLSVIDKPSVAFLQGHGEPSLNSYGQVYQALSVLYNVSTVTLNDSTSSLNQYKTLIISAPKDSFPASHLKQLDNFLAQGRNIYIGFKRVALDLQQGMGNEVKTNFSAWLEDKGLKVDKSFVVDKSCGQVMVTQQQGMFNFQTAVPFHYLPDIKSFAEHPITKGITRVILHCASPLSSIKKPGVLFTPLAQSSNKSGSEPAPIFIDINRNWTDADFPLSGVTVGAVLSGHLVGDKDSKIVLISDGDFAINGEGQQARQLEPDNVNLMVNSIDWLSDDTGLIDLRTKTITSRPLDTVEPGTAFTIKLANFLIPILIVLVIGFFRMQSRKVLRNKRMEGNYV